MKDLSNTAKVAAGKAAMAREAAGSARPAAGSARPAATAEVGTEEAGQRIDNYLLRVCKGVPRSHVYRILRSGEVRVNSRRVDATYRVEEGDRVRIPPIRLAARDRPSRARPAQFPIVFEDAVLLVIDKPAGTAVHGGSGVSFGVIESLRAARPEARFLELVHRLDRETSGLLMVAKKRSALTALHAQLREGGAYKRYLALVPGAWKGERSVNLPLRKYLTAEGERRVSVDRAEGRESRTDFRLEGRYGGFSLLSAILHTGRTHQIRVHLAHLGFAIAGDDKYGDFELNKRLAREGLKRMFLHATEMRVRHPLSGEPLRLESALPAELQGFLEHLAKSPA
jgi:23S rRNA pseudouridine955/2504/2580 synthase